MKAGNAAAQGAKCKISSRPSVWAIGFLRATARPLASRRPNLPGRLDDMATADSYFSRKSQPEFPIHRITIDSADLIDQKDSHDTWRGDLRASLCDVGPD